ncbi:MAG: hypothetical protein SOX65_04595 [Porphyromonas sp.]|uniref:hypothetical protein n=1 Tax=Porphyromonas sp. TaxID=1924944 RepID=UPI002A8418D6|nr:hypothetical protein [Porphyromonas sp.]MDY4245742.1 hypothetical protein [Porphyromonas sp.]
MTQEELRAKLESYDVKGAEAYALLWRNDSVREMVKNYEDLADELFDFTKEKLALQPTYEVIEVARKLRELILAERAMYRKHSALIKRELMARLEQEESND